MAESHEQEPKPKKKTTTKPRTARTTTTARRKKPAASKKSPAQAAPPMEAAVEPEPPPVAPVVVETVRIENLPPAPEPAAREVEPSPPRPVVEAPAFKPQPLAPRETFHDRRAGREAGTREVGGRDAEIEDDSDFHAGLWPEEPRRERAPVVEEPPARGPAPWEIDRVPGVSEPPVEDMAGEIVESGEAPIESSAGRPGPEAPAPGTEPPQNGERRRRRRRGRRGRGRGRDQEGNGQTAGQQGVPPARAGDGGPAVGEPQHGRRPEPRDQHDQRGRDQRGRDQHGRHDRGDHRDRQDRPRQDRDQRDHREHRGKQDQRDARDPHDRRDRGGRRPEPQLPPPSLPPPQPATEESLEEAPELRGSGERTMLINVAEGEECRIAILHQGRLEELFMERASTGSHVGNIYKGRVTNVEPSIQAAFIDFGMPKNGFLHISDLQPQYFPDGMRQVEEVGRKTPRRERPPIQKCLRRGQEVLVQIIKEGIGTKGPTLTTYISIPGRFLVMLPGMNRLGVSRKIEDEDLRRKMRRILDELELPRDMGFILRTAGMESAKRELQRDLQYLQRLWKVVANRIKNDRGPCELYQESDLVIRTVRDVFSSDFGKIIVDDEATAEKIRDFLSIVMPRGVAPVEAYKGPEPLFHKYHVEEEIERINARHVPLPLGGSLVIDSTEALVAIDVNSGRFRDLEDAEETAYRINIEAAEEIARQLRLRDLGGLIVCDFIDMRFEKHRRAVERSLRDALKKHKERAKCLRMSQFGIIEMTRQRMRPSIKRSIYQDCPHCRGSGLVKNPESMTLDIMRLLRLTAHKEAVQTVEVRVAPTVAHQLLNRKRTALVALEQAAGRRIVIRSDGNLGLDQYLLECLDARGGVVETIAPPVDTKAGADLRPKRNAPPPENREGGHEAFEDVFD